MSNLFEKASRKAFRFNSFQGMLTVEDLWDLPLLSSNERQACLNDIAVSINSTIKHSAEENFVDDEPAINQIAIDKLDIVKHIIAYKKAAAEKSRKAQATRAKNQRIMEIITTKEDNALQEKSLDELRALMEDED